MARVWAAAGAAEFVQQLIRERSDVVLASLGVPYALQDYPDAAVRICTYSDVPVSQQALAEFSDWHVSAGRRAGK